MLENLTSDKQIHLRIWYDDGIMRMQEHETDQMGPNLIEHEKACLATLS
jgi:hypothetical protein